MNHKGYWIGKEQIKWLARAKVLEFDSQGHNQSHVPKKLHIGYGTVTSDFYNPLKHTFKHKHLWVKKATNLGVRVLS